MAKCRNCGAKVFWAFNEDGRSMGFDLLNVNRCELFKAEFLEVM